MTTIDLGEMPHPRPTVPSLLDRFWDQFGLATMTALILAAVTTAMVLAAPVVLR